MPALNQSDFWILTKGATLKPKRFKKFGHENYKLFTPEKI